VAVSIVQIFQKETALMMRAAISAIVFCGTQIYGQTPLPTFEAASVKPNKSITESSSWHSRTGYLVMRNQTLNDLIRIAYQLKADQVTGGPKWLVSDRFDIEARASGPARDPELLVMLQTLLAERFQLKLHRDTKLVSGYALIVAKGGMKVRPVEGTGGQKMNWGRGRLVAERASMDKFAETLARMTGSPVVNSTGILGEFTFQLEWTPEPAQSSPVPGATTTEIPERPSLFSALQQELGLRLEPRKTSIEILTIDKAERPSEN